MVSAVPTSDLNLDLCAQEPIRHPVIEEAGSLQPHGMLPVVDPDSLQIVVQASANVATLPGDDRRTVLGLSLRQVIGTAAERHITAWLRNPDSDYSRTSEIDGQRLQVLGRHDERHSGPPALARRETILVVEDDAGVRAFTIETVRELGYDVLEARDGNSALNVLRQTPAGKIDLLFSAAVLPGGINEQQWAQQARELHPHLKVLFATGYARDVIVHHGRLDPGVQLITEPFAFEDLAPRLRSVLDDQDSSRHVN